MQHDAGVRGEHLKCSSRISVQESQVSRGGVEASAFEEREVNVRANKGLVRNVRNVM